MGSGGMWTRLAAGVLAALTLGCGAKEDEEAPSAPVAEEAVAPEVDPDGEAAPELRVRRDPRAVREALARLDHEDPAVRREAVAVLRRHDYELGMITRLAVRPSRPGWRGRGVADLLAEHPDEALPVLLDRLTYSSPTHRAAICGALGAPRTNVRPAIAVLTVRALLDAFPGARAESLDALEVLDETAQRAVADHFVLHPSFADGSVARLDPALLLEEGRPFAAADDRRMLVTALEAEAKRSGPATILRIAGLLASDAAEAERVARLVASALEYATFDEEACELLVALGGKAVPILIDHLHEGSPRVYALRVLGQLGRDARGALPDLLAMVAGRQEHWEDALVSVGGIAVGDAASARALLPLLGAGPRGEIAAWTLAHLDVAEPDVLEALGRALVERLEAGEPALRTEDALLRLAVNDDAWRRLCALALHPNRDVARAAVRVLSLCDAERRDAVRALYDDLIEARPSRSVRMEVRRSRSLLDQDVSIRLAERRARLDALEAPPR